LPCQKFELETACQQSPAKKPGIKLTTV